MGLMQCSWHRIQARHTGRGARGNDRAVETGLGHDIDLDGGVSARVVDGTGVNLGDSHLVGGVSGIYGDGDQLVTNKRG